MRDHTKSWISKEFEKNARKAFPNRSMYQITKELNAILEDLIYGKKR